ncbi:hypothetical protein Bca52824_083458 [Brassica carinata]|uniref:Uncharacterized protein n=1 Tax=Brassica carinata TaxID=52824 RepID=A0A8X7TT36_BRACI|nr:hypothetical protein Bca52824_083458 [Brassica carinata]
MRGNLWKLTFFCLMRRFPVVIRFKNLTEFVEITTPPAIPLELFRFYDYGQLIALLNTNHQFPDVLRFVGVINSTFSDHEQSARPIMVDLQVDRLSGDEQSNEIDGPQTRHPHPVAAQHNCEGSSPGEDQV